jgi:hypothetical protein
MLRWWAVVLLVGVAGCFSDVPPDGSGSTGSTSCTPGEVLCACRGDSTCDAGLACVPEGCIPDACDPGEAMCTCLQPGDVCAQGSTCIEGLCRDEPITTDGMTSMPSESGSTMEPPMTSTGTTAEETAGTTSVVETSSLDSGGVACSEETLCTDCALCASQNECENQFAACMRDMTGCMGPLMCIQQCLAGTPDQWEPCVEMCGCGDGNMPLQSLVECTVGICDPVCEMDLPCGGA